MRRSSQAYDKALTSLATGDREDALEAIESKEVVNDLAKEATAHLAKRLVADEPGRLAAFQIETDIIENYRRINVYSRRIAKLCLKLHPGSLAQTGDRPSATKPAASSARTKNAAARGETGTSGA